MLRMQHVYPDEPVIADTSSYISTESIFSFSFVVVDIQINNQ
jgi:hypothetical protein